MKRKVAMLCLALTLITGFKGNVYAADVTTTAVEPTNPAEFEFTEDTLPKDRAKKIKLNETLEGETTDEGTWYKFKAKKKRHYCFGLTNKQTNEEEQLYMVIYDEYGNHNGYTTVYPDILDGQSRWSGDDIKCKKGAVYYMYIIPKTKGLTNRYTFEVDMSK